jgi:hypothetical protein
MIRTKDYLSWSQYDLFNKSKRGYWKRYGLLEENIPNRYFEKGKEFADAMQFGPDGLSTDPLLEQVVKACPRLDIQEDKVEVVVENGEKILCYIDSSAIENDMFLEYKTGKEPWTQEKVEKHKQLDFYALVYWIRNGRKDIPKCKLIWIETYEEELDSGHTVLRYTGNIEEFERGFIVSDLVEMEKNIIKTIEAIEEFEYIEMDVEEDVMDRYIELHNTVKECQEEMDTIKLGIKVEMEADEVEYASSSKGRFGFTKRKKWKYSEGLEEVIAENKKMLSEAMKEEVKNGSATYTETKSLTFKAI